MDRFPLETAADLAANSARNHAIRVWGDLPETESAAVLECQNCGQSCAGLTWVPEFEYSGCDDCVAEGMAEIAKDPEDLRCPGRIAVANESADYDEFRVALRAHVAECEPSQQTAAGLPGTRRSETTVRRPSGRRRHTIATRSHHGRGRMGHARCGRTNRRSQCGNMRACRLAIEGTRAGA